MTVNVFVLGLDKHNELILRNLPDAEHYLFHALLSMEEMRSGEEIALWDLLDKAVRQLDAFEGSVDAIRRRGDTYRLMLTRASAGDGVGAGEERSDFCAVQVTGDCLITFYGHDSVDVNRAVGDLPCTRHLGR